MDILGSAGLSFFPCVSMFMIYRCSNLTKRFKPIFVIIGCIILDQMHRNYCFIYRLYVNKITCCLASVLKLISPLLIISITLEQNLSELLKLVKLWSAWNVSLTLMLLLSLLKWKRELLFMGTMRLRGTWRWWRRWRTIKDLPQRPCQLCWNLPWAFVWVRLRFFPSPS